MTASTLHDGRGKRNWTDRDVRQRHVKMVL